MEDTNMNKQQCLQRQNKIKTCILTPIEHTALGKLSKAVWPSTKKTHIVVQRSNSILEFTFQAQGSKYIKKYEVKDLSITRIIYAGVSMCHYNPQN